MPQKYTCYDCRFYLPVDAFKGICKHDKSQILPELLACEEFQRMAKCKFCENYFSREEFLGMCSMQTITYPDLAAAGCKSFVWLNEH